MRLIRSAEHGGGGRLEPVRRDLITATGEIVPVSISAALVFDDEGREIATVGIFSDLRERLRMEERLASAQERLAVSEKQTVAIELAGAAAHELNQPLTSVMGYAQMLVRKLTPGDPHLRIVETILNEAERMAAIVRQLGSLTRYETKSYVGGAQIIDLDRSAKETDADVRREPATRPRRPSRARRRESFPSAREPGKRDRRMKPEQMTEALEQVATQVGVRVRYETMTGDTAGAGGLCKVKGQWTVIIDRRTPAAERAAMLIEALAGFDTDGALPAAAAARGAAVEARARDGRASPSTAVAAAG